MKKNIKIEKNKQKKTAKPLISILFYKRMIRNLSQLYNLRQNSITERN